MPEISGIYAREILDARGLPAVEAEAELSSGVVGRASVSSGENARLDGDAARYAGRGVLAAAENIEKILRPELAGMDVFDQLGIDRTLLDADGSANGANLGANALLAVSLACAQAASAELRLPLHRYLGGVNAKVLPIPLLPVPGGPGDPSGKFMIRPVGADCFAEALKIGSAVLRALEETGTGEIPDRLPAAAERVGFVPGKDVTFSLDLSRSAAQNEIDRTAELVSSRFVDTVEAPREVLRALSQRLGGPCQLVGNDLSGTEGNNAVLIGPDRFATVTGILDAVETARKNSLAVIIASGPGGTGDCSFADLAVAVNAGQIKIAAADAGQYNQLLRIEEQLGMPARYGKL